MPPAGRPLTPHEARVVAWLLAHGEPAAAQHANELADLRVVGSCPCGCASVDFTSTTDGSMTIVADFGLEGPEGPRGGVFLFARGGRLAGLEVWSVGAPIAALPEPESFVPLKMLRA